MSESPTASKPLSLREDALAVVRRLRDAGHIAYFAGGCVRDMVMGRVSSDYDVATDATPDRVRQLFRKTQAVGAAFGVVLVRQQHSVIEVATFRTDLEYRDGRHPVGVKFSSPEEDAARRDFTINGMFFDPASDTLIDFVGGQQDIRDKILRAIGDPDRRFAEDHLRLFRAIRFAARFGLTFESTTAGAIERLAPKIISISPERVGEELRLMLTPPSRTVAWDLLKHYRLDEQLLRFLKLPDPPPHPEVAARRSLRLLEWLNPGQDVPFGAALSAAAIEYVALRLPDWSGWSAVLERKLTVRSIVNALRQSLRLSNDECEEVEEILRGLLLFARPEELGIAQLKRFLARSTSGWSWALIEALPDGWIEHRDDLRARLSDLKNTDFAPPPLLTGDDLTAAGLRPGPSFKRILDSIYDAQLEGRVATKDAALALAMSLR